MKYCFVLLLNLFFLISITNGVGQVLIDENKSGLTYNKYSIGEQYKSLETLSKGMFYIENLYVDPHKVEQSKLVQYALKGITSELDPHTTILSKQSFEELTMDTQGKFGGVGIVVSQKDGKLIVVSPIEDTPAWKAGIKANDEIVKINSKVVGNLKLNDAINQMRGEPGTTITLTIKRNGRNRLLEFKLVREIIKVKSIKTQKLADNLYYVKILSFQEDTSDDLHAFLKSKSKDIKGLILDIRDNPGGLLDQAVRICDFFIESGIIVATVGRDPKNVEKEFAHKRDTFTGFALIVLVNGSSASASEILAGALQDHQRAVVVGTKTFGKGSVQTLVALPDGSGLKITVARYFTPKGRSIQAKGIEPDIVVPQNPVSTSTDEQKKSERDLAHHLESQDLSSNQVSNFMDDVKKWDSYLQDDYQLKIAFSYLKSWAIFHKIPQPIKENL